MLRLPPPVLLTWVKYENELVVDITLRHYRWYVFLEWAWRYFGNPFALPRLCLTLNVGWAFSTTFW